MGGGELCNTISHDLQTIVELNRARINQGACWALSFSIAWHSQGLAIRFVGPRWPLKTQQEVSARSKRELLSGSHPLVVGEHLVPAQCMAGLVGLGLQEPGCQ